MRRELNEDNAAMETTRIQLVQLFTGIEPNEDDVATKKDNANLAIEITF